MHDDVHPDAEHPDLELEVGVGVREVELRHLVSLSSVFAQLLNEVGETYTGTPKPVKWIVEVRSGSVKLPLRAESASESVRPTAVHEIPTVIAEGIGQLEREAVRPEYFSDRALEHVKALANQGVPFAVRNGGGGHTVSKQAAVNAELVLGKPRTEYGTIEGRLEELSIHGSQQFAIWQWDGRKVRCNFGTYLALADVLQAVGKRVAARGTITSRPTGEAMSVDVEYLRILGSDQQITAESVRGILRDHEVADW